MFRKSFSRLNVIKICQLSKLPIEKKKIDLAEGLRSTHKNLLSVFGPSLRAYKEAACTLSEAYADNSLLNWATGSIKDHKKKLDIYEDIFKALIRTAVSENPEFAVQLNGCKGVMLWSEGHSDILSIGNIMRKRNAWGSLVGLATMRHLSKMKKKIMSKRNHLSINIIGVLPAERRQQVGTHLMQYVLKKADEAQLPVFAEVWGQDCLGWFQKFDFTVQPDTNFSVKDKAQIYYVVREPRTDGATATVYLEPPREDALS